MKENIEEDLAYMKELLNAKIAFTLSPTDKGYEIIENLLKAYREDEEVIEEMANEIFIEHNPHFKTTEEVEEYFRNKVKENKHIE